MTRGNVIFLIVYTWEWMGVTCGGMLYESKYCTHLHLHVTIYFRRLRSQTESAFKGIDTFRSTFPGAHFKQKKEQTTPEYFQG